MYFRLLSFVLLTLVRGGHAHASLLEDGRYWKQCLLENERYWKLELMAALEASLQ